MGCEGNGNRGGLLDGSHAEDDTREFAEGCLDEVDEDVNLAGTVEVFFPEVGDVVSQTFHALFEFWFLRSVEGGERA